jgi:2-dehydropantoate 2-reductase
MSVKIAVVGTGANGASIAADLVRAGQDVTLIDQWPANVEVMRSDGVTIKMPDETLHVNVRARHLCEVASMTEPFDVVLLLVKAYDTRWACELIKPLVKDDGLVVAVQNGMTTDAVADILGAHRTMGSVIEISSGMFVPGVVERDSPPDRSWFAVGSVDPATAGRETEITTLLGYAGTAEVVENIRAVKWMKLVSNTTTLVPSAILGLPLLDAVALPEMRDLMIGAGKEALRAGELLGYPVLPIFGLAEDDLERTSEPVELLLDTLTAGFVLPRTKTTVLQDWEKKRRSEVDDINGRVITETTARGGAAPINQGIVELAHRIERGEAEPSRANLPLLLETVERAGRFERIVS